MADTETAVKEETYNYNIKVEDAGPATKKVSVEIPEDRIKEVLEKQFVDLKREASIPGFRPGKAPRKLVERRFSSSIKEEVRRQLVGDSYRQALENNKLEPLGEPEFDNPDDIQLPESGPLTYTFSVEVQPEITLPDMATLTVKKPKVDVTDTNVDQAMDNLRQQQGALVPVEDRGVEDGDYVTADVHVKLGEEVIAHQHDAQLVARSGRIAGITIEDLAEKIRGAKGEETRTFTVHVPEAHSDERIKDKDVQVELAVKDIKKLELAEIDQDFLERLGFTTEAELRDAMREQLEERIKNDVQTAMRTQVQQFLVENVQIELPTKLTDRQRERTVQRRAMDLATRGIAREQIEQNMEVLQAGAGDEAQRELKLFFILQKVAKEMNVDVEDDELNGRISGIAAYQGRRPEKMKQEMSKDGSLANLYVQMREHKAIDKLIEQAKIEEVEPEAAK